MKRRIVVAGLGAALVLAGCKAPVEPAGGGESPQDGGWTATPRISTVEIQGEGLVIRGDASPGARVVLRGDQDVAFAAAADRAGRFELRVATLPSAVLLTPEVQIGQLPTPGPEQLVLADEGRLLAALLIEGGASRRLSRGPILDSVDGDGRGLVVSGRAGAGVKVAVSADGGAVQEVTADEQGRWVAALTGVGDRPASIAAGEKAFAYPGPAAEDGLNRVARAGAGWRVTRALSASARQTSWFPDA